MPKSANRATVRAHIDRMVKRIVRKFQPEQVILFDSQARNAEIMRSLTTLEYIHYKPAADFWNDVNAKQPEKKP